MTTVRILDPLSGDVIDVDTSVLPFVDEIWARIGGPQTAPEAPGARTHQDTRPGSLHSASFSLIHADTAEPARPAPAPRPKRDSKLIVPWSAGTCAKVRDGLPARYQAMVPTGQGTGLRFGELSALAVEDLDRGHVLVRRQAQRTAGGGLVWALPKNGKQRVLPLDKNLAATLRAHQARFAPVPVSLPWDTREGRRETFHILFATISGGPLDRAYALRMWRTAVVDAGMTPSRVTGTHQLRHHFASELVGKGTDLETVRRLLGHADLLTTQRYIHSLAISDKQARAAVAKVTPRPRPAPALPAGVADFSAYKTRRTAP